MSYLSNGIQERLHQSFMGNDIAINVKSDHVIARIPKI